MVSRGILRLHLAHLVLCRSRGLVREPCGRASRLELVLEGAKEEVCGRLESQVVRGFLRVQSLRELVFFVLIVKLVDHQLLLVLQLAALIGLVVAGDDLGGNSLQVGHLTRHQNLGVVVVAAVVVRHQRASHFLLLLLNRALQILN